jgi:hypothetical protein
MLVTSVCNDPTIGSSSWLMYRNNGAGFDATATSLALPSSSYSAGSFEGVSGGGYCQDGGNSPQYQLLDMDGDGKPDMLVTSVCTDPTIGSSDWLVYTASCSP